MKCSTKYALPKTIATNHLIGTFAAHKSYSRCKNGWVEIPGNRFFARSSWEANYGRYLEFQRVNGMIRSWQHEPETFWFEGIKRGTCSYLPDFKVTTLNGTVEYHEVKGWMDHKSKTKIKRMAKYHPLIRLIVIDSNRYKALAKTARTFVPEWR